MDSVSVIMSTYNGEKYVEQQINSIMAQKSVDVKLYIRDDGSTDSTLTVLENLRKQYPEKIILSSGNNLGYRKSFMTALRNSPKSDFYAFSDQDDVWFSTKCINAIDKLKSNIGVKLYASAQIITDEKLNQKRIKQFSHMGGNIESHFTRHSLPGCTYLFTDDIKAASMMIDFDCLNEAQMPSHDFIVLACALALGYIYIDDAPSMLYRRIGESQTPSGGGLNIRIKHEWKVLFGYKNKCSTLAREIIENFEPLIDDRKLFFLKRVSQSKSSLAARWWLLRNKKMDCGILLGNMETKLKIILGTY